jgi:hypothetical protein
VTGLNKAFASSGGAAQITIKKFIGRLEKTSLNPKWQVV